VQRAQKLLGHYEALWRGRIDRMGRVLESEGRRGRGE
jgi:hypothetical protein